MILGIALSGMAAVTFLVSRGIMKPYAASIVGYDFKSRLIMAEFTLGLRTVGKSAMYGMAEHTGFGPRAVCSSDIGMAAKAGPIPYIRKTIHMVCRIAFSPCRDSCCMAIYTVTRVRYETWFAANIQERWGICMTPNTCLIVAKNGNTVCWMAGITVYRRPYPTCPWKTGSPVGHNH
jgi:hypothetical protein